MLKTSIAGVAFPSYIFNASGPCDTTFEELSAIGASQCGAITMKSSTLEFRAGNEEPRYVRVPLGSINSMGLPNLGYKQYIDFAPKLKQYNKPIVASLAGLSPDEFPVLVKAFQESDADVIEVNLSCPNVKGKPQIGYDFAMSEQVLKSIMNLGSKPLGVKLPPYFDAVHWDQMAEILLKFPLAFVCCINSVGNTLIIDPETERPLIKPKGGFGGLGGEYIKPVALANVRAFYERLQGKIAVIGVGGIATGTDAFEFLLAGADAVQVGTQFEKEGPDCFERISRELEQILKRKGYADIAAAKGKLKIL